VFAFLNKTPAVKVSIQKQPEANTITVVDGVKQQIQELRQSGLIPADMTPTLDESRFIRNSLADVTNSAISGALAAAAVLLFLGSVITSHSSLYSSCHNFHEAVRADSECVSLAGLAVVVLVEIDTSVVILRDILNVQA